MWALLQRGLHPLPDAQRHCMCCSPCLSGRARSSPARATHVHHCKLRFEPICNAPAGQHCCAVTELSIVHKRATQSITAVHSDGVGLRESLHSSQDHKHSVFHCPHTARSESKRPSARDATQQSQRLTCMTESSMSEVGSLLAPSLAPSVSVLTAGCVSCCTCQSPAHRPSVSKRVPNPARTWYMGCQVHAMSQAAGDFNHRDTHVQWRSQRSSRSQQTPATVVLRPSGDKRASDAWQVSRNQKSQPSWRQVAAGMRTRRCRKEECREVPPVVGKMATSLLLHVRAHVRMRSDDPCAPSGAGESTLHFLAGLQAPQTTNTRHAEVPDSSGTKASLLMPEALHVAGLRCRLEASTEAVPLPAHLYIYPRSRSTQGSDLQCIARRLSGARRNRTTQDWQQSFSLVPRTETLWDARDACKVCPPAKV